MRRLMSADNLFYHYATVSYPRLLSKNAQIGKPLKKVPLATDEEGQDYNDNISLFIEPVPLDILSKLWPAHPFWFSGAVLYQHVIRLDDIPDNLIYDMVETPEFRRRYQESPVHDKAFWKRTNEYCIGKKITGSNKLDLTYCADRYRQTTRQAFINSSKQNPDTTQYAPDVPHLMTIPLGGCITVSSVSKVTVK